MNGPSRLSPECPEGSVPNFNMDLATLLKVSNRFKNKELDSLPAVLKEK